MNETLKNLLNGNREYIATGSFSGDVSASRRAENAAAQKPRAAIVTCSDSRVIPEVVFSAGTGELFVVRTAGNVIGAHEFASLEYAIDHLHVETVIVMGHTGCGAVKAAIRGETEGAVGVITKQIRDAIGSETEPVKACALNVRQGVEMLKKRIDGDNVAVAGAVYDILSGEVKLIA